MDKRKTKAGLLNRQYLLDEVVFREFDSCKAYEISKGLFTVSAAWGHKWEPAELNFQLAKIVILKQTSKSTIVLFPNATEKEVREEFALAQCDSLITGPDPDLVEEDEKWEFERGAEAAADAAEFYIEY